MKNKETIGFILIAIFILIVMGSLFIFLGKERKSKTTIGFVMTGSADEEGWNGMQYDGVTRACDDLDVNLLVKENINEGTGQCVEAVEELIDKGASMIILSSYGYGREIEKIMDEHKEIVFYCNDFDIHKENVTSYFTRMYQARYLAGIVAGKTTKNNKIGYVAAMPNSEVNRGISAFTLGVKRVNPEATVTVIWTGNWDSENIERECAKKLISECGVDLLTYHQNQTYVIDEAEKAGIYSIGYHQVMENASEHCLTATVCDWQVTYGTIIKQYLQGKNESVKTYWVGLEEDSVKLSKFSSLVTEDTIAEVEKAKSEILSGKDVFSGVIYDNKGNKRCNENEVIRDDVLLEEFDWFVEDVKIYEK